MDKNLIKKKKGGYIVKDFVSGVRLVETDANDKIIYKKKGMRITKDLTGTILISDDKTGRHIFL